MKIKLLLLSSMADNNNGKKAKKIKDERGWLFVEKITDEKDKITKYKGINDVVKCKISKVQ